MNSIDPTYGSFSEQFTIKKSTGIITIHPEMLPVKQGITPTGRYHIYCVHPEYGSCIFVIEQDNAGNWISTVHPQFISMNFICWVGQKIEGNTRL